MENAFIRFFRDQAPVICGVNPEYGKLAEFAYRREIESKDFSREKFSSVRERMALLLPYAAAPGKEKEREYLLDVAELAAHRHDEFNHPDEYNSERREELEGIAGDQLDMLIEEDKQNGVESSWWTTL